MKLTSGVLVSWLKEEKKKIYVRPTVDNGSHNLQSSLAKLVNRYKLGLALMKYCRTEYKFDSWFGQWTIFTSSVKMYWSKNIINCFYQNFPSCHHKTHAQAERADSSSYAKSCDMTACRSRQSPIVLTTS